MEDNLTIDVAGNYLGINSVHGIGRNHARIFIRRLNGSVVDGLVPINIYNGLIRGNEYNLHLIKANDPQLTRRVYISN